MKNLWGQMEPPFVTWMADLKEVAERPSAIFAFVEAVLSAGAKHRIFDVLEAPDIAYLRARDGALVDVLRRDFERDAIVDLFGFTGDATLPGVVGSSTIEATLCHYDERDQLVESAVVDLGALLASLEPVPGSIPNACLSHYPALRIVGNARLRVGRERSVNDPLEVRFAIHSDIWFPWVYGVAHPEADFRRMFDNRELAMRHTPRLNAFLAEVANAARSAGGSFRARPDESGTPTIHRVTDDSVLLDWEPTEGVMPPEMLDVEWY